MEDTTKQRWGQKFASINQTKEHSAKEWLRGVGKNMHRADANTFYAYVSKNRVS